VDIDSAVISTPSAKLRINSGRNLLTSLAFSRSVKVLPFESEDPLFYSPPSRGRYRGGKNALSLAIDK
jgi:hypothetical protein